MTIVEDDNRSFQLVSIGITSWSAWQWQDSHESLLLIKRNSQLLGKLSWNINGWLSHMLTHSQRNKPEFAMPQLSTRMRPIRDGTHKYNEVCCEVCLLKVSFPYIPSHAASLKLLTKTACLTLLNPILLNPLPLWLDLAGSWSRVYNGRRRHRSLCQSR